jgi:predicted phosphohydrolase
MSKYKDYQNDDYIQFLKTHKCMIHLIKGQRQETKTQIFNLNDQNSGIINSTYRHIPICRNCIKELRLNEENSGNTRKEFLTIDIERLNRSILEEYLLYKQSKKELLTYPPYISDYIENPHKGIENITEEYRISTATFYKEIRKHNLNHRRSKEDSNELILDIYKAYIKQLSLNKTNYAEIARKLDVSREYVRQIITNAEE